MEVAKSPRGPDAVHVILAHDVLHHGVLLLGLDGHQVHTHGAADVPSIQPTGLQSQAGVRVATGMRSRVLK